MAILVTGGAGYIGSHAAHALADREEAVVVLDNLSAGVKSFVPPSALFIRGNAGDGKLLQQIIRDNAIAAVMHFAGSIVVPESIERPLDYYANNTAVSRTLIHACVQEGVRHLIFSSTAAIYGAVDVSPVPETAPARPLSPYGHSKLMTEWMLEDAARAHDFRYVALRYFNVAGIDPGGRTGQPERQVPHLIKRAAQVAIGSADHLDIFGADYPTHDGTAVRDYIHVCDLVDAHRLAVDSLRNGAASAVFNCGYGKGSSVLDVVSAFERVTGRPLPVKSAPRRVGDAACVVADPSRLVARLGWQPRFDNLDTIVRSALEWEERSRG